MRRRQFIALLGGAAATWPLTTRAQREPLRHVAILEPLAKDTPGAQERAECTVLAVARPRASETETISTVLARRRWSRSAS